MCTVKSPRVALALGEMKEIRKQIRSSVNVWRTAGTSEEPGFYIDSGV